MSSIFSPQQSSTQDHLDIEDIRQDLVIMKNGTVSVVIESDALNFELLAGAEQDANIYAFANFLNSITFPVQIVIRTVATDISGYVDKINKYQNTMTNNALSAQVDIYKDFISNLTQNTNILDKSFFVVIPTKGIDPVTTSPVRKFFGKKSRLVNIDKIVEGGLIELQPKRDHILKQFKAMNLNAWQLKNDELIKLYYSIYDPDRSGASRLGISEKDIDSGLVASGYGGGTVSSDIKQEL